MIIDCVSDLHGYYPKLEGGDLLIVAGDLTARDTEEEYTRIFDWMYGFVNYEKVIFIAGNHDNLIQKQKTFYGLSNPNLILEILDNHPKKVEYLCDSGTEFKGLKIWGSPWTKTFPGMNPHCKAFTVDTEEELAEKWALIPDDTDILITHGPPLVYFDRTINNECVGSYTLCARVAEIEPILHVFGHIHECGGNILDRRTTTKHLPAFVDFSSTTFVNCSHVNERYQPVNKPIRIEL